MKTLTIRNVPSALATALEAEKSRRGLSLNRTVLAVMQEALGVSEGAPRGNRLCRLPVEWLSTIVTIPDAATWEVRQTPDAVLNVGPSTALPPFDLLSG